MSYESGVSEVVGTILLVSIVVLGVSIISVAILSQPLPEEIPQLTADVYNQSRTVNFTHTGGDSIRKDELSIRITGAHDEEFRGSQIIGNATWALGDTLRVNYNGSFPGDMPETASVIYNGGSTSTLILRANLVTGEITGGGTPPTTLPTATTAATIVPITQVTTATSTQTATPTTQPTCSINPSDQARVYPIMGTITKLTNGSCSVPLGYRNENPYCVRIAIGDPGNDWNEFTPPPRNRGQPSEFQPGTHDSVFTLIFTEKELKWKLGGNTGLHMINLECK